MSATNLEKIERKVNHDPHYKSKQNELNEVIVEIKRFSLYSSQLAKEFDKELNHYLDCPKYLYTIFKKPIYKMFFKRGKELYPEIIIEQTKTGIKIEFNGYVEHLDIKYSKKLNFFYADSRDVRIGNYILLYHAREYLFIEDVIGDLKTKVLKKCTNGMNGRDMYEFTKPKLNKPNKFTEAIVDDVLKKIVNNRHSMAHSA